MLAGVAGCSDFALSAAVAETAGDEDAVELLEFGEPALRLEILGVDANDVDAASVGDARVAERFVDRFVGVLELDVFSDDADAHLVLR